MSQQPSPGGPAKQPPMDPRYNVNFFRPRPGFMRRKVGYIWLMLLVWGLMTFGFQGLLVLLQRNRLGEGALTEFSLFGFPFHFWYSGQLVIVGFILICFLFNVLVDRLTEQLRRRR